MTRVPVAAALAALLALSACTSGPRLPEVVSVLPGPGWHELTGSPLAPRTGALGLWTGSEALIVGGSDAEPCPPAADCPGDPTPLRDGAAVDPATGKWRRIAELPAALRLSGGAVVGRTAFAHGFEPNGAGGTLLAYSLERDSWEQVPPPPGEAGFGQLVAMGDQLVIAQGSHEDGRHPDFRYDPAAKAWHRLPDSPLGDGFDRGMVWTGRELVLFDHELVPDPGAERPSLTRMAALDPAAGTWRRLPDAQQLATGPWLVDGGRLVNPQLGGEDGGQVGNWGRTVPYGGIVDVAGGAWSPLPDVPVTEAAGSAYGAAGAVFGGGAGPALDVRTGTWQKIPRFPHGDVTEHTVVAAGNRMLVFGGARWPDSGKGELIAATWLWAPPA